AHARVPWRRRRVAAGRTIRATFHPPTATPFGAAADATGDDPDPGRSAPDRWPDPATNRPPAVPARVLRRAWAARRAPTTAPKDECRHRPVVVRAPASRVPDRT